MPRWKLAKTESTTRTGDTESTRTEATVHLDATDPDDPMTLDGIAALVDNLKNVRGIPGTARLTTDLDAVLTWEAAP